MAKCRIACPHCGGTLEAQDEWCGMTVTCPLCRQAFIIPRQQTPPAQTARPMPPPPPPPPVHSQPRDRKAAAAYEDEEELAAKNSGGGSKILGILAKIVFAVLIVGGGIFWSMISDELSADNVARDVETKEMTKLFSNKDFIYYGALVQGVKLTKDKNRKRTYSGEVRFSRNGRSFTRPISVTYDKNGKQIEYRYGVDFDYSRHPEFLEEDADIFFNSLKNVNPEMKTLSIISSKYHTPGVIRYVVTDNNGNRTELDIQVDQTNNQFSYKVINARELK